MSRISTTSNSIPAFSYVLGIIIAILSLVGMAAATFEICVNEVEGDEFVTNCIGLVVFLVLFFLGMWVQNKMVR